MKHFDFSDAPSNRVICLKSELVYAPPEWMKKGLQETRSGYGSKLNSGYFIHFHGKLRRIYTTIFSNAGTCWFMVKGQKIFVSAH